LLHIGVFFFTILFRLDDKMKRINQQLDLLVVWGPKATQVYISPATNRDISIPIDTKGIEIRPKDFVGTCLYLNPAVERTRTWNGFKVARFMHGKPIY
ncbi:hypothetical protein ACJX0J_026642, partial [Zea mays]